MSERGELYRAGQIVSHSSDGESAFDVGISIGLGRDKFLFVGECHSAKGWALVLYHKAPGSMCPIIADRISTENAHALIDAIRDAINAGPEK